MKLLSIIVPIYNMEIYLQECLDAFARQRFDDNVEIILIDDGSTDNSLNICKNAAKHDKCYRVIHQENKGVAVARNIGLEYSNGLYIAWVDPDDYITDDWWSTIKKELDNMPEMVYFDMYLLRKDSLKVMEFDNYSRIISNQELCEQLAVGNRIQSHLPSKIILRKFYKWNFSTNYSYCEDFALLHRVICNINRCNYIHRRLYVYRQIDTSIVHNKKKMLENYRLGIKLYKKRYRYFITNNIKVPYDGIYGAMINYCYEYRIRNRKEIYEVDEKYYKICIGIIKNNFILIIKSKYLMFRQKIKMLFVIAGMAIYTPLEVMSNTICSLKNGIINGK